MEPEAAYDIILPSFILSSEQEFCEDSLVEKERVSDYLS